MEGQVHMWTVRQINLRAGGRRKALLTALPWQGVRSQNFALPFCLAICGQRSLSQNDEEMGPGHPVVGRGGGGEVGRGGGLRTIV
jgi:hypothetical protein